MRRWKTFQAGGMEFLQYETPEWKALVSLTSGGNLIRLHYTPAAADLLRFPRTPAELESHPECFGTPLLLPPNRIADGCFCANGFRYHLPLNDPLTNSHLHGLVLGRPWKLISVGTGGFTTGYLFDSESAEFPGFPHEFRVAMRYCFASDSVVLTLSVWNSGDHPMPLGVGFHTAFLLPCGENVTLSVPRGNGFWEVHPHRRLPTGHLLPWEPGTAALLDGRLSAASCPVASLFPVCGTPDALIRRKKFRIRYVFDQGFHHLACWNGGGGREFFCIEPMSWMTNAPNLPLPPEISGLSFLESGKTRIFRSEFRVEF